MERVVTKGGPKVPIPSRMIISIDKQVFIENVDLPEDIVVEDVSLNDGLHPSVTLRLKRLVKKK